LFEERHICHHCRNLRVFGVRIKKSDVRVS
jgi:hypothetical protein